MAKIRGGQEECQLLAR